MAIKNYIFDLGGVLYALDFPSFTQNLFSLQKNSTTPSFAYSRLGQPAVMSDYEKGKISTATFRECLRQEFGMVGEDALLDRAWNSILVGLYPGREALIRRLKQHYRLSLLSNINDLHFAAIKEECQELFALFDRCFFSFLMGHRKPELEAFREVLDTMEFLPEETIFIDDSPPNVEAAQELGIQSILLQNPDQLFALFDRELEP